MATGGEVWRFNAAGGYHLASALGHVGNEADLVPVRSQLVRVIIYSNPTAFATI